MNRIQHVFVLLVLCCFITACGGGADNKQEGTEEGIPNETNPKETIPEEATPKEEGTNTSPEFTFDSSSIFLDENVSHVMVATATDKDESDVLTFSLSGIDAERFFMDANTGELLFLTPPNFELPADENQDNIYELTLRVADQDGSANERAIEVHIQDTARLDFDINADLIIFEHGELGIRLTPENNTQYDVVIAGVDGEHFLYESATGLLSFRSPPDYESPLDENQDNIYSLTLQLFTLEEESAVRAVDIEVKDIDESRNQPPTVVVDREIFVDENQVAIVKPIVTDLDAAVVTLSLEGDDASSFVVDRGTIRSSEVLNFEAPADLDSDNRYDLIIVVSDSLGASTRKEVSVIVRDVDETVVVNEPPVLTVANTTSFEENALEPVLTFTVADPDSEEIDVYLTGDDARHFTLDQSERTLLFNTRPDFENPVDLDNNNIYQLKINASDTLLVVTEEIEVIVTDVNDSAGPNYPPRLTVTRVIYADPYQKDIPLTASATDRNQDEITYSVVGDNAHLISIDASTGDIDFADDFNFDELPDDVKEGFTFTVRASDSIEGSFDDDNVKLTFYSGKLDILFPGRFNRVGSQSDHTSLVVKDMSGAAEEIALDGINLVETEGGLFVDSRVEYEASGSVKSFEISDGADQSKTDSITLSTSPFVFNVSRLKYWDSKVFVNDAFDSRLYSADSDAFPMSWEALSCPYTGDGSLTVFAPGGANGDLYAVISNSTINKVFRISDAGAKCFSELAPDVNFSSISDIVYDGAREVVYLYEHLERKLIKLDPDTQEATTLIDVDGEDGIGYLAQNGDRLYLVISGTLYSLDLERNTHQKIDISQEKTHANGISVNSSSGVAYIFYAAVNSGSIDNIHDFQLARVLDLASMRFVDDEQGKYTRSNFQNRLSSGVFIPGETSRLAMVDGYRNNVINISLEEGTSQNAMKGSFFINAITRHIALDEANNSLYLTASSSISSTSRVIRYMPGQGVGYEVFRDFSVNIQTVEFDPASEKLAMIAERDTLLHHDPKKYNSTEVVDTAESRFIFDVYYGRDGAHYMLLDDYNDDATKVVKANGDNLETLVSFDRTGSAPYRALLVDGSDEFAYVMERRGAIRRIQEINLETGDFRLVYESGSADILSVRWGLDPNTLIVLQRDGAGSRLIAVSLSDGSATDISSAEQGVGPMLAHANDFVVHKQAKVAYLSSVWQLYAVDLVTGNRSLLLNESEGNNVAVE